MCQLTSVLAGRAARQIIEATRQGRAVITPHWQARAAQIAAALAPNAFATLTALVDRSALPSLASTSEGDVGRLAATVDPGVVKRVLSDETRREHNQPDAAWS